MMDPDEDNIPFPSSPISAVEFGEFATEQAAAALRAAEGDTGESARNLDLLLDVQVPVTVEVGATRMTLDEVLDLVPGRVVRLDKKAEDPVDLRVNGKLIARGEVVMVDDCYGLRITRIVHARERLESLR